MKQKSLASKLKKGVLACGAAMLLCGLSSVNAQLYVDGGSLAGPLTGGPGLGNGYIGLGTDQPDRQLEIKNTGTAVNNTWFEVTNDNPLGGSSPGFAMRKSDGVPGAPLPVTVGDRIGFFLAAGWDNSGIYRNASGFTFKIDGAVSPGTVPANVEIETGAPTRITRFIVHSDGRNEITNINTNFGEYLEVDLDGTITTSVPAGGGGGTSNWDSPAAAGAGEGNIWYTAGTTSPADDVGVNVDFSIAQDNSVGIQAWYTGANATVNPVGVNGYADAGLSWGVGVYGWGGWMGGRFSGGDYSIWCSAEMFVNSNMTVTGTITNPSDRAFKENVDNMQGALTNLMKLQPSSYDFKTEEYAQMNLPEGTNFGFIAQELQEVFPHMVKNNTHQGDKQNKFDFLSVDYLSLIPVVVGSMKEQNVAIKSLNTRLETVEAELLSRSNNFGSVRMDDVRPNPIVDNAQISYDVVDSKNAQISIYNATSGRLVTSYNVSGQGTVNVTGLSAGHYTYALYVDNVKVSTKKMVVVK